MKTAVMSLILLSLAACAHASRKSSYYDVTCFAGGQPVSAKVEVLRTEGNTVIITDEKSGAEVSFINTQCIIAKVPLMNPLGE